MGEEKKIEDELAAIAEAMQGEAMEESGEGAADAHELTIATLTEERDKLKDQLLRSLADGENLRKRAERERKDAEAYGGTRLARDLLSVHDNLERAIASLDEETRAAAQSFVEGVELTQKEMLSAFAKHKIEAVRPEIGEKFDPNRHQAMFEAPAPGAVNGTVIEVMQPGFTISERLLRPALVGVAKSVAEETEAAGEDEAS